MWEERRAADEDGARGRSRRSRARHGSWRETQQALLLDRMWALRERAKSRGPLGSALSRRGMPSPQVEETETSWVEEK